MHHPSLNPHFSLSHPHFCILPHLSFNWQCRSDWPVVLACLSTVAEFLASQLYLSSLANTHRLPHLLLWPVGRFVRRRRCRTITSVRERGRDEYRSCNPYKQSARFKSAGRALWTRSFFYPRGKQWAKEPNWGQSRILGDMSRSSWRERPLGVASEWLFSYYRLFKTQYYH